MFLCKTKLYGAYAWIYVKILDIFPQGAICKYFGVKIAMYFAWLGHYTTALTIPAVVGIFFWVRTSSRILFDSINLCYLKEVSKKTKIEILYYIDRFLKYVHLRVRISISISVLSIRESLSLNVSVKESLCVFEENKGL